MVPNFAVCKIDWKAIFTFDFTCGFKLSSSGAKLFKKSSSQVVDFLDDRYSKICDDSLARKLLSDRDFFGGVSYEQDGDSEIDNSSCVLFGRFVMVLK